VQPIAELRLSFGRPGSTEIPILEAYFFPCAGEPSLKINDRQIQFRQTLLLITAGAMFAMTVWLPFATASATVNSRPDKPWASPTPLLESLVELEQLPIVAVWANETHATIESVVQPGLNPHQRAERLALLEAQHRVIAELNKSIWASDLPDQQRLVISARLLTFRYELTRRISTWNALLKLPSNPSSLDSLKQRQVGLLDFSQLDPTWADYLLLGEFQKTFRSSQSTEQEKRKIARKVLARIYSPVLQPSQATYVQQLFEQDVIDFLKAHASRPVDASNLARRLELYESQPTSRSGFLLNEVHQDLLWSDDPNYQQAAQAIETHYRNANFRMTVSQEFMNRLLPELPTIAEPVSETVQGARVSGRSQTSNRLNVALVPDPAQLNFQIQTNGHVQSDTVARTKSFRILNQGYANFLVTKQISVNRNGFDTSHKPYSNSTAQQVLIDIQSKMDKVPLFGYVARRAAEKRIREKKAETNQLFRRKVAKQAEIRVEQVLIKQVNKVQAAATKNLLEPLVSMDLDPVPMQLATTDSEIVIRYRLAGRDQMAANTARPVGDNNALIEFQLHQSLVNNSIARLGLNGETFTGPELAAHMEDVFGFTAKANDESSDQDAEFRFAKFDPIRLDFVEDRVNFTINLDSLKIGDSKPLRRLSLTASYGIEVDGMMVKLTQDQTGTLAEKMVRGKPRPLRLGERAMVSTVMKMLFEDTYSVNALPKKFRDQPKASTLSISRLVATNGWLGVSFNEFQTASNASDSGDTDQRIGSNLRRLLERR
jgi:hypothetical protein